MINSVISDRYIIQQHLGRGGMSDVYRAIQKGLNRPVAVKVMRSDTAWDAHALARFKQEAVAVAQLDHHNIVSVYDYGEYEGNPFMVFRYVAGGSIKDRMGLALAPALVLNWIRQIASALDYAHSKGIAHRDLKPDNVLMTEDGTLLLSDFGIAKILEDDSGMTKTGSGFGTPHYMSPEQALGQKVDHRTDIYALGIMLFQMLTGKLPFQADTSYGVVMKHATEPVPHAGGACDEIVQKACAKNAGDRYQSCGALVSDLAAKMKSAGVNIDQPVDVPQVIRNSGKDEDSPTINTGALALQSQPAAVASAPSTDLQPADASALYVQQPAQPQPALPCPRPSKTDIGAGSGVKTALIAAVSVVTIVGLLGIAVGAFWHYSRGQNSVTTTETTSTTTMNQSSAAELQPAPMENSVGNEQHLDEVMQVTNARLLTEADLNSLTPWELTALRNSIYARHGREFRRVDLQDYFKQKPWYRPDPSYSDASLNEIEKKNASYISDYQQRNGKTN